MVGGRLKQKIVVRAIIQDRQGKILLLRRNGGRPLITGKYELPGGKINTNEQPVDAMRRTIEFHTGLSVERIQLLDTMTFIDPEDRELQYMFVVFSVALSSNKSKIRLSNEYDKYIWKKKSELQQNVVTNSTYNIIWLDKEDKYQKGSEKNNERYIIFTDGGSRGNPGPSAAGFIIMGENEEILCEDGLYLGRMDNNTAEYLAAYLALKKALILGYKTVELRSDSLLLVNQINGIYQIKTDNLRFIHGKVVELISQFDHISFQHIKREFNRLADGLVNKILDENLKN